MTVVDRLNGVNSGLAYKAPCRVATTANITLSGLQTIDGVALAADDRVLVKDQTTASENGIYVASSSTWTRAVDCDGNRDLVKGSRITVTDGSAGAGVYELTTSNPITIGSSSLTFTVQDVISASAFMLTALDDADAEEARTTFDVGQKLSTDPREYDIAFDGLTASATANVTAWNTLIAAINAGTVDTVVMPAGICYINATLDTITWAQGDFTLRGQGHGATQIRMTSDAGTAGTFFTFGDADDNVRDFMLADFGLECENEATLNGTGNALVFANTVRSIVVNVSALQVNGLITLGSTSLGTSANQTRILLAQCITYVPGGGKTIDIQSSANHNFTNCQFSGNGTAVAGARGLYIHPATTDSLDAGRFTSCVWNFPNTDIQYIIEMDATDNDVANQRFIGCTIDQAVSGACVYMHVDSGATSEGFEKIIFVGCTSNASTGTAALLLDNTGGKNFDTRWIGGTVSTNGSSGCVVNAIGGNRVDFTLANSTIMNRSTSSAQAAIVVATGTNGLVIQGNTVATRNALGSGTPFVPYTYLVEFEGTSTNNIITGNDAMICTDGLILKTNSSVRDSIIKDNIMPDGAIQVPITDKVEFFDDFLAAAIDARISSTAGAGTGNQAATTVSSGLSGEITLKTASDDGTHAQNGTTLTLDQLNFKANQGSLAMETRLKVDDISSVAIFVGFTDTISTTVELPIYKTAAADTIDSDATDACGIAFDTDGTTDQWFIGGVAGGTDTAATHSGSSPVNDTYVTLRVEVGFGGSVTGYVDGTPIGTVSSAVTATTALTPAIIVANRSASQRTLTVDYIWATQTR